MATQLTAAVVGGGFGGRLSMTALEQSERFRLIAAADINPDVLADIRRLYPDIRTFTNHRDLLLECRPDVICVSTFPPSHEAIALDALTAGVRGLLVEKPLANDAAAGRRILDAARGRRVPLVVPHGLVAKKTPVDIIRRIRSGDIGRLNWILIENTGWDLLNAGIHWLHYAVTLLGDDRPVSVLAQQDCSTRTYRDGVQVETESVTLVETASGVRILVHIGDEVRISEPDRQVAFRLIGTDGMIEFWGWDDDYRIRNAEHPSGATIRLDESGVSGHRFHLERLADMIETGRPNYLDAERSYTALEIIEAAFLSGRYGCKISLPLSSFVPQPVPDWRPGCPYTGGGGRDGKRIGKKV